MIDWEHITHLLTIWLLMADQCPPWEGADADEAVSEAVVTAMQKPIADEQAHAVYRTCLLRLRGRRLQQWRA